LKVLFIILAALGSTIPAAAHHSFAAQYDGSNPVTLRGVVTRLDFMNPHALLYLDVTEASGRTTAWVFELGSPNGLKRDGFTRNSLKKGDAVIVRAYLAKDGSATGNVFRIDKADGTPVLKGDSNGRFPASR
jgi:Family of unknown function (DUF6152)